LESNHHLSCIRTSLRFLIICNRKITGVKRLANNDYVGWLRNSGRKRLRMLQLRMLGTKVDVGKIPGMLAVNRQRTEGLQLGAIFLRSKSNSAETRNFWMLH
jgi:CO dehydrogenase/acetyl-CoA synthase alpha subunit